MAIPFPPIHIPVTDRNSNMTQPWREFLEAISNQVDLQGANLQFNTDKIELTDGAETMVFNPTEDLYLNGIKFNNPTDANQVLQYLNGEYVWVSVGDLSNDAPTGTVRMNFEDDAPSGWITLDDGTIGSAASSADNANDDNETLYKLIWNNISDTYAPVTGGRNPSADQDWALNKPIQLPQVNGRAIKGATTLGKTAGTESHTMTLNELPLHQHTIENVFISPGGSGGASGIVGEYPETNPSYPDGYAYAVGYTSVHTSAEGGGNAQTLMQPTVFGRFIIKL